MSDVWFTSDTHIGHERVALIRGFESTGVHDEFLAHQWDRCVQPHDDVWVLGDVALGGWRSSIEWFTERPGRKHLVLGNHDRAHPHNRAAEEHLDDYLDAFYSVQIAAEVSLNQPNMRRVLLSHFPYAGDRGEDRYPQWRLRDLGQPLLHGHTHSSERVSRSSEGSLQIHVGVDAWDFTPVRRHEVVTLMQAHLP